MRFDRTDRLGLAARLAASLIVLYYAVYLILCLAGFDVWWMSFFALFVMSCSALPVLFSDRLKKKLGRAFRPLRLIFTILLWVYLVSVAAFWSFIGLAVPDGADGYLSTLDAGDTGDGLYVLVFGCQVKGTEPGVSLKLRLDEAYRLLEALPDAKCVVSGGQGANELLPEAEAMKNYLVRLGIGEDRIIGEPDSHTTSENIRFTAALLEKLGLSPERIVGVSNAFHLPRIRMQASRYGLPLEACGAPSPHFGYYYVSMVREYLSYIKMALFDKAVLPH